MDIGKMRGDEFIDRLEQLCHERGIATRRYKKPTNTRVAPREMIADIAANCHAVIRKPMARSSLASRSQRRAGSPRF